MTMQAPSNVKPPPLRLLVCCVVLALLVFTSCDIKIKMPSFPFWNTAATKENLIGDIEAQFSKIHSAHVGFTHDDITIYFLDETIEERAITEVLGAIFTGISAVADSWSIHVGTSAYSQSGAITAIANRVHSFSSIEEEEVSYGMQIRYKDTPFTFSGEIVFQDIHYKLKNETIGAQYIQAFNRLHRPILDKLPTELTIDDLIPIFSALQGYALLPSWVQDSLPTVRPTLEGFLTTLQEKTDSDQWRLISSLTATNASFTVNLTWDAVKEHGDDALLSSDIGGLTQYYTPSFSSLDGSSTLLDLSSGATTIIVHMDATPKSAYPNLPPIAGDVVVKIGSVSIGATSNVLYTIEDAIAKAGHDEIFVRHNTSFASAGVAMKVYGTAQYRIGSPTTIVLPYDNLLSSGVTDTPGNDTAGAITRWSAYVRLNVPSGITIDLKGRLVVNAKRAANETKFQGHVTGKNYSVLNLEEGSKITIKNRGELHALGFVEGAGITEVEEGGYVYEGLFISSFRGGTASSRIEEKVFPFDQFTLMQIESPLLIKSGANYIAKALIWASSTYRSGDFPIASPSGLIRLNDGTLRKTFDPSNGHVTLTIDGNGSLSNSSVKVGSMSASTAGRAIPFDGTWHFVIASGKTVTVDAKIALLPGSSLTIRSGAVLKIRENTESRNELTIFSDVPYRDGYNSYPNKTFTDYYRAAPIQPLHTADSKAEVLNLGGIIVEKNSGIAGRITNSDNGSTLLKPGAITGYDHYFVKGSADTAEADPVWMTYYK